MDYLENKKSNNLLTEDVLTKLSVYPNNSLKKPKKYGKMDIIKIY